MKPTGFYHPQKGYWQTPNDPSLEIRSKYPAGTIEVGAPPTIHHKFVDGVWLAPTQQEVDERKAQDVRYQRNLKLISEVDTISGNALRWAALSEEQQSQWAEYRQALLDVPNQSGFPHNVTWPLKPE